jgi:hypothetical protein
VNTKILIFYTVAESIKNLQLGNLDTGLQVKEEYFKHRNGYLVKSCKDLQTSKNKKGRHQRKN